MRIIKVLLVFLLAFFVIVVCVFIVKQPSDLSSTVHPQFSSMLHSGNINYPTSFAVISYLFGLGVIGTLCFFVVIGAYKEEKLGDIKIGLGIGSLTYIGVYTALFYSYISYSQPQSDVIFVGGWPSPTAWMMYAMWATPLIFVFLYMIKYRDWILSEEDEAIFQNIKEQRAKRLSQ